MPSRTGLIAGGNWIVDHVKLIDVWPSQDSLAQIYSQTPANGGSPYNILKDLAKLGASFPLEAVGLLGNDELGRHIRADCAAHGIDTRQLHATSEAATSYTDVMTVRADGRRTFFHQRGANALLAPAHFDFTATRAKIFHLGYLLLLDRLDASGEDGRPRAAGVLHAARTAGLLTSLDCVSENSGRFASVVAPVLPEVDVLFANDFEAENLTGLTLGRGADLRRTAVEAAARALLALGVRAWVLIHFPEGVCACSRAGEVLWQPSVALPPARIVGTVGAGDAFAAGVLCALHEDWPMARGLALGVAAAATCLEHATCSESIRSAAACLALATELGHRPLPPQ